MTSLPVNPLREARESLRLSIATVATRAGVSRQYVIRAEQGTYPTLPETLLPALFPEGLTPNERHALASDYADFQYQTRRNNTDLLPPFPLDDWLASPRLHPLTFWRHQASPVVNLTQLAKGFCLPQSLLFKFESQAYSVSTPPEPLMLALRDAGHTDYTLESFRVAYSSFRASQITAIGVA